MIDLAQHYAHGPVQISEIAKRQGISVKYLEQLIIPLKKADFIRSVRGPKGGHMLARQPKDITVGEIVKVLEGETSLSRCIENPEICDRSGACPTRDIWGTATRAMFNQLDSFKLSDMIESSKGART